MKLLSVTAILVGVLSIVSDAKQCWIKIREIEGTISNIDGSDGTIDPYIKIYGYNAGGSKHWKCDTDYDYNDVTPEWYDTCYIGDYDWIQVILKDHDPDSNDSDDYLGETSPDIDARNWKCDGNWYGPYSQDLSSNYGNLDVEYEYRCTC